MTPEQQATERRLHEQTSHFISTAPVANGKRPGILDLTAPGRALGMHQSSCVRSFLLADYEKPFDRRGRSLLAMHPMGTGKTISAIACIAGLYKIVPQLEDFVVIIIAPKSVLAKWCETVRSWTTLGDDCIVMAEKETDLTADTFRGPKVIVTTKEVVLAARKTYMYWDKQHNAWTRGIDTHLPHNQRVHKRAMMVDGALPAHPLFAHVEAPREGQKKPLTLLCCDEAHGNCRPGTLYGDLGAELARAASFVLGLSGTPVTSDPSQAAHLCHLLNARPTYLQCPKAWSVAGAGKGTINEETVKVFHQHVCDIADPDLLDGTIPSKIVHVRFDPFIGRRADGTYDKEQHEMHDRYLNNTRRAMDATARGEEGGEETGIVVMQMCTTTVQLCFSATLGMHGAKAFLTNNGLYDEALKQPSQQMRLIWRMLRHRQMHGRRRIVVYSPAATMLELLRNQLAEWGGCGRLFLYTGKATSAAKRDGMINDFLGPTTSRGVLLISGAGAIGTTLCPGCETLFVVGDIPWTKAELRQAESRVHRMTQKQPVEIVRFVPRHSIVEGKYRVHACEAERLYPAIESGNFEHFKRDKRNQWKLRESITTNLAPLDALGNYCAARVMEVEVPPPVLADDFHLPPVSFPIDGFVETRCDDDIVCDGDDGVEASSAVALENRKRARDDDDGDASGTLGI